MEKKKKNTDDGSLSEITADRLVVPELGAHVQTRAADGKEWSEVAIVVKVGTEDKLGQLKIVGTEGSMHKPPCFLTIGGNPRTPRRDVARDVRLFVGLGTEPYRKDFGPC